MNVKRFSSIAFLFFAIVMLTNCSGLSKMLKNANLVKLEANPKMLEMHADNVDYAINGQFPAKYFQKKVTVTVTPVLKYQGGEKPLKSITLQGEKVQANNKVVNYENGGSFTITDKIPYSNDLRVSEIEVRLKASYKDKSIDLPSFKVADGIIATPQLVKLEGKTVYGTVRNPNHKGVYDPFNDEYQRITTDKKLADIHYPIEKSDIQNKELKKEDIANFWKYIDESVKAGNINLKNIDLSSYASPDGPVDLNTKVSSGRDKSAEKYLAKEMKKKKMTQAKEAAFVNPKVVTEDWDGFKELMQNSNIKDKELILRVLSMYSDNEVREKEIKNISAAYTEIAEKILPELRRSKFQLNVEIVGKSDEELLRLALSAPDQLNPAELIYAAKLTEDLDKKAQIYKSFSEIYKDDWRGKNNLGVVYIRQNKATEALAALKDAKKIESNNIVLNNLGVAELLNGNFAEAESLFNASMALGSEPSFNLTPILIKKGNYADAVKKSGEEPYFNTVLAKMLNGDNNGALKILDKIENKDAMVLYLKAVISAKLQNEDNVMTSLKSAIDKDSKLAAKAKTDMEFFKYFDNPRFKEIVK